MIKIVDKFKFYLLVGFLFSVLLVISLGIYADYQVNTPLIAEGEEQIFEIESGQGLEEIARDLDSQGLIKDKVWFMLYIFYRGWAAQLQAGDYILNSSLSIPEIAQKIFQGDVIPGDIIVTIPEGFTLKQIDARLAAVDLIEEGELLSRSELEGYLFPDTYQFGKETGLAQIITEMMDNFNKKLNKSLVAETEKQGKIIKEIVTMASILEKEAPLYSDRQIISGIFWKRIRNNYPLQSCATIAYVLGVDKWIYSIEDTEVDSPYNTYRNVGLPPGPINNPGLLALKAAVYPLVTDYNFFLSAPSGETIYSRTFEEHKANKEKYLR